MFTFDKTNDPANPQLANTRIRYGKIDKKNTLVTVKQGDVVYWGISRANTNAGDMFRKSTGRAIAYSRALKAMKQNELVPRNKLAFDAHESGLRGHCHISNIYILFDHFDNIGQYSLEVEREKLLSCIYNR